MNDTDQVPFRVGDFWRLNSGGPQLTVREVGDMIRCSWDGPDGEAEALFHPRTLTKVSPCHV